MMGKPISNTSAIVTGSNRGIGAAVAKKLATLGYAVAINCRNDVTAADSVKSDIIGAGGLAEVVIADVSIPDSAKNLVDETARKLGPIEVLINNVGPYMLKPLLEVTPQEWNEIMAGNLNAPFYMIQEAAKRMIEKKRGRIINIGYASCHVPSPRPKLEPYSIAKTALYMLTRAYSKALAGNNITVNMVSPGIVETSDVIPENIPMKRAAKVDEICDAVEFLVSEKASYITGANMEISGGWNII